MAKKNPEKSFNESSDPDSESGKKETTV